MLTFIKLLGGVRATIFAALLAVSVAVGGYYYHQHGKLENQIVQMELRAKAKETSYYKSIFDTVYKHHEEQRKQTEYVATLQHDVATGKRMLKARFTCPTGPATGSDGGEERGLRREDGGFLIGEAARADGIVRQLQLCQNTIKEYQELNHD
jgi:hypothetical protein